MYERNRHTTLAFPAAEADITTQKVALKPILLVLTLGHLMHTVGGRCPVGFWLQSQAAHTCMAQHRDRSTLAGGD